jgi:hypothetical protein
MSFQKRPGDSDVASRADSMSQDVGRVLGNPGEPSRRVEAVEDDWKIPMGPLDDLEPEPEPVHAGGLLHRLTHRG